MWFPFYCGYDFCIIFIFLPIAGYDRRFEVAFVFFYNIAKRVRGTKKLTEDPLIMNEYQRLVNKRFPDSSSITAPKLSHGKKVSIPFFSRRLPIPKFIYKTPDEFGKYLKSKVKELKRKMGYNGDMGAFREVSDGIIKLYHYIYLYAPE